MGVFDKLKKFVDEKKTEKHFKKAGTGQSLSSSRPAQAPQASRAQPTSSGPRPTRDVRPADQEKLAAAALQRIQGPKQGLSRSQKAIQEQARREIEKERVAPDSLLNVKQHEIDERELESAPMLTQVLYTCELLGDDLAMTKDELHSVLHEFLQTQLGDDAISAACMMIQTLNTGRDKKQQCTDTLTKYITNIINRPDEEKFRKIRCANKALQERVLSLLGGEELLTSLGFERQIMEVGDGGSPEEHFYMQRDKLEEHLPRLRQALDALANTQPIALKLYRNPSILSPGEAADTQDLKLPDEFFDLTADDVRRQHDAQKEQIDRMLTLRTRDMRERDETMRKYRYKYTLVRVAMPDGYVLQGTFNTAEKVPALREFVRSHLELDLPFELLDLSTPLPQESDKSLGELNLMPAALLRLQFEPDVMAQLQKAADTQYLKRESIDKYSTPVS